MQFCGIKTFNLKVGHVASYKQFSVDHAITEHVVAK